EHHRPPAGRAMHSETGAQADVLQRRVGSARAALGEEKCTACRERREGTLRPAAPPRLQARLEIGRLDDPLETEADSVAERVLRMPDRRPIESVPAQLTEERPLGDTSDSKRGQAVRATPAAPTAHLDGKEAPVAVRDVLATAGAPLDSETRAFFEARFGQEFSGVRVHHDAPAAASALEVGARAYTVRSDIVFA